MRPTPPHHASPPRPRAARPHARRALTTLLAAAFLLVGLTPAQGEPVGDAPTADGSSFSSPLPLPLDVLDGTFAVSNVGLTTGTGSGPTTPPKYHNGRWYEFVAPATTSVVITLNSAFDNALEVWTADGGLVGVNDDGAGYPNARLTVHLTAGTAYRFAFAAVSPGRTGAGTVTIRPAAVPSAPTDVVVTPADRQLDVNWTAPQSIVAGWDVYCAASGGAAAPCGTAGAASTSTTITGLTNGTTYDLTIVGRNSLGAGQGSTPVSATPRATTDVTLATDPVSLVSGEPFDVAATFTRSDGVPVTGTATFSIGDATYGVTIEDGTARIVGLEMPAGAWPVSVNLPAADDRTAATTSGSLVVDRAAQTVTLDPIGSLTYGDAPVTVAGTATSGGALTFTGTGACTVDGTTLTVVAAGDCTVTAAQAGTTEIHPATADRTVTVAQAPQSISLELPALVYDETAPVVVSSSLDLPVDLTASGACVLTDGDLTATDVGPCTVTATQAGTDDVAAATPVTLTTEVGRRPQEVTIAPIADLLFSVGPVALTASSSLGLPVTLVGEGACVVVDGALHTIASGECTITAEQAGDAYTLPAVASTTIRVVGTGTSASLQLDAGLGAPAAGASATVRAVGMLPGSELVVTVYSTPRELARVTVGADGTAGATVVLPAGLEAGDHRLVAAGVGLDGAAASAELGFAVDASGRLVRIGDSVLVRAAALAVTGTDGTLPVATLAVVWLLLGAALVAWRRRVA
ncbi:fibronectin type III domain-containing protein [Cellulomonas xiejunii]|uniref:Fibronectin type III domain-containing protein n=1 Tax=Cellulomonas xiejunii TaxID=2968083 RepID=A0ABY5KP92_9CELL|nr:fibronectin type III domain-containing protein [Cellulomonas xiejunii]MCC2321501.1 fibronectin type III domain-containing protein [Cellulomonas xiejunii]MCC2323347.1 fibronectin type III domain-containing protein [Cellulomonas xiejunii]UUI72074.1 fibronectin type III domain-containing protein [Cellulomonas xiejunii]